MVAINSIIDNLAVTYSFVEGLGDRNDIMHARSTIIAQRHECGIFIVLEEGILNFELVRHIGGEQVGASCVSSFEAMRA